MRLRFALCTVLVTSAGLGSAAAVTQKPMLAKEVREVYIPRAPYWKAAGELVCQLEVPAGLAMGRLPSAAWHPGRLDAGQIDLRFNPGLREYIVGPFVMRHGTVRSALDGFCRASGLLEWTVERDAVVLRANDAEYQQAALAAIVPAIDLEQASLRELAWAVEASEGVKNLPFYAPIGVSINGVVEDDTVLVARADVMEWLGSVHVRNAPLSTVLSAFVGTVQEHNGVWIGYEFPQFGSAGPITSLKYKSGFASWLPVRRRLPTHELVRELLRLRALKPTGRGTRGYETVAVQTEDYWRELRRRAHFDPEPVAKLVVDLVIKGRREPALDVEFLVALESRQVVSALAMAALQAEDRQLMLRIASRVPRSEAFRGLYREFWRVLAQGGQTEFVQEIMRARSAFREEEATRMAEEEGERVDLNEPSDDIWFDPFSSFHIVALWDWPLGSGGRGPDSQGAVVEPTSNDGYSPSARPQEVQAQQSTDGYALTCLVAGVGGGLAIGAAATWLILRRRTRDSMQ